MLCNVWKSLFFGNFFSAIFVWIFGNHSFPLLHFGNFTIQFCLHFNLCNSSMQFTVLFWVDPCFIKSQFQIDSKSAATTADERKTYLDSVLIFRQLIFGNSITRLGYSVIRQFIFSSLATHLGWFAIQYQLFSNFSNNNSASG